MALEVPWRWFDGTGVATDSSEVASVVADGVVAGEFGVAVVDMVPAAMRFNSDVII